MAKRRSHLGDTITTVCEIQPNGTYTEHVTMECTRALDLKLAEPRGFELVVDRTERKLSPSFRWDRK